MKSGVYPKIYSVISGDLTNKERREAIKAIKEEFSARFSEEELCEKAPFISKYFADLE